MKIKFSITKEFDIEQIIKDEEQKKWFWKNSFPSISEETRPEELTDAQKIALIKLLIYEGWLGREADLSNLPASKFALINEPVETTNEQPNLLKLYEKFRDSDILEGLDEGIILAFLYYVKKGNLEGKSFNPNYYKNTEKDVLNCRIKDLEKLYNITIIKNEG